MLARVESIDGIRSAEVDHAGELLWLELRDRGALERAHHLLAELGYSGDELSDAGAAAGLRWHRGSGVRELSWEEAHVIARRVVPRFARARDLGAVVASRLADLVAAALYDCFTRDPLESKEEEAVREACSRAVERAARPLIGDEPARALGDALWADFGSGPDA